MDLELLRFQSAYDHTLGALFSSSELGRTFLAFTLEDEHRTEKKYGETRIPAGRYRIELRTEGGFHERYARRFPSIHKGMLWVREVPGFEFILLHVGNEDGDTAGCILVGSTADRTGTIGRSTEAYIASYPSIAVALEGGADVWLTVTDYDRPEVTI